MARRIKNGELVALTDGNEEEFLLDAQNAGDEKVLIYVEAVASGSGIRFASGEAIIDARHRAWPAGSKFPISVNNSHSTLRGKGLAGETFVATW